jgi:hypothetical protein
MKLRLAGYFDALDEYGIPHEERYLLTENISLIPAAGLRGAWHRRWTLPRRSARRISSP